MPKFFVISGDSEFYFIEKIMCLSLEGTLIQTRTGIDRVTSPGTGPIKGQYVFL